jgi:hypothetical protein
MVDVEVSSAPAIVLFKDLIDQTQEHSGLFASPSTNYGRG